MVDLNSMIALEIQLISARLQGLTLNENEYLLQVQTTETLREVFKSIEIAHRKSNMEDEVDDNSD